MHWAAATAASLSSAGRGCDETHKALGALLFVPALALMTFAAIPEKPEREAAKKLMNDGNWKEAYDGFSALALDPADDRRRSAAT